MSELNEIQAELIALGKTLELIDKDYRDGTLSEAFYYRRRIALVRDNQLALKKLKDLLERYNAPELSSVLEKLASGATDGEVEKELEKAQEAGQRKGWGDAIKKTVAEKRGSIVQVVIEAALKAAKFLIGV